MMDDLEQPEEPDVVGAESAAAEHLGLDWLRERLAQPTSCMPEWRHVLELYDVLQVLEAEDIRAPALEALYNQNKDAMDASQSGGASIKPAKIEWRGAVVGAVHWLIKHKYEDEYARACVASAAGVSRVDLRKWIKHAKDHPVPTRNYKLNVAFAASKMQERLDDVLRRKHNELGPEACVTIVQDMFVPVKY